jgi:hypothetical protein
LPTAQAAPSLASASNHRPTQQRQPQTLVTDAEDRTIALFCLYNKKYTVKQQMLVSCPRVAMPEWIGDCSPPAKLA